MESSFLLEEERCGHIITKATKKLWSVELSCYEQLKKICEKHNIQYFAGGGTLLGVVRHQGFIPWDDDIDIHMFPDDYDKFCRIAREELSEPFFFQHYTTQEGYAPSMARIRRSDTTGCTQYEYDTVNRDFHCGIFIDIFPMYGIADGVVKRIWQKIWVKFYRGGVSGYELTRMHKRNGTWNKKCLLRKSILLWQICSLFWTHEKMSKKFLDMCNRYPNSKTVTLIPFWGIQDKCAWERSWWENGKEMPFEYTTMPCPVGYDKILRKQYGDYTVFEKGTAIHTMAVFDADVPYTEKLKQHYEEIEKNKSKLKKQG